MNFTTRRRIVLVQMIYALTINNPEKSDEKAVDRVVQGAATISRHGSADNKEDKAILGEILSKLDEIDSLIEKNCQSLSRLPKVVLSIIRVGVYELKYSDVQHKVGNIIKDYLNIAVALAHDFEVGFINGILDKIHSY